MSDAEQPAPETTQAGYWEQASQGAAPAQNPPVMPAPPLQGTWRASSYGGWERADPLPARPKAKDRRSIGFVGLGTTAAGIVLLSLSFTVLTWFHAISTTGPVTVTFNQARRELVQSGINVGEGVPIVLGAYFLAAGWALFVAASLLALIACLDVDSIRLFRVFSLVLGVIGAGCTIWALVQVDSVHNSDFHDISRHMTPGVWTAFLGFLLVGLGGFISEVGR